MGTYLSTPVKEKHTCTGSDSTLTWAAVDMQGWRKTMEDAFVADMCVPVPENTTKSTATEAKVFGVFDGHGGGEVALFCKKYMVHAITSSKEWQEGNIGGSLIAAFHKLDRMIDDQDNRAEITGMRNRGKLPPPSKSGEVEDSCTTSSVSVNSTKEANSTAATPNKSRKSSKVSTADAIEIFQKLLHLGKRNNKNEKGKVRECTVSSEASITVNDESTESDCNQSLVDFLKETTGDVTLTTEEPKTGSAAQLAVKTSVVKTESARKSEDTIMSLDLATNRSVNVSQVCTLDDHPIHAGCTSIVAILINQELVVANAGDSRAVLCRAGGIVEPLSYDHKPSQEKELERIKKAGGFVNQFGRINGNLNLSRSIGDLKYKQNSDLPPAEQMITAEPDIKTVTLEGDDEFIIFGCDGIWDCLSNDEAVKYVRHRIDTIHPAEIIKEMLDEIISDDPRASQGIGGDNMTAVVIDLLPNRRSYSLPADISS
mmetsp:Transcript_12287/g.18437  ORF Transcript_12287/g.18437 Transcript_12287/m.18437 type:complete len:485 (-) Transcript_12287:58-1512(-)|eukprot:CAMPEP_0196813896 /NCGR_PEP_ID=MMETSP1362-20130617/39981_1 /TAXON_ID=163516 /ORGANISM="Leptocylindrus danicus, Strain CCMP1856" /LENGTH=484 /DNA_ID=CAMNT_0042190325 /DNA_START=14 /DNA_END=1468 /DNA_ORIENTATION=+